VQRFQHVLCGITGLGEGFPVGRRIAAITTSFCLQNSLLGDAVTSGQMASWFKYTKCVVGELCLCLFGKQVTKETKLRIRNMTAKAALKFGSEVWVLKKKEMNNV
jgi:hypothetical protein